MHAFCKNCVRNYFFTKITLKISLFALAYFNNIVV